MKAAFHFCLFAVTRSIWGSTVFSVRVLDLLVTVPVKLTFGFFGFLKHHGNKESKHKSFTYTGIISVPDNIENICDSCVKLELKLWWLGAGNK